MGLFMKWFFHFITKFKLIQSFNFEKSFWYIVTKSLNFLWFLKINFLPCLMIWSLPAVCIFLSSTSLNDCFWIQFLTFIFKIMVFQIKGDLFCRFLLYVRRRGILSVSRIESPHSLSSCSRQPKKMMLIWELFSAAPESQATRRWLSDETPP